jgi:DNA-binding NtrC family response regulator
LWRAIVERGLGYGQAIWEVEKELLEIAVEQCGETRRELANRLRTSERTLYHKLRAHKVMTQSA